MEDSLGKEDSKTNAYEDSSSQVIQVQDSNLPTQIQQQCFDNPEETPKASKDDDSVVSRDTSLRFVLYPANLSNEEVNNILDKQGEILQDDNSSDELEIEKEAAIHI
ncbi:hypothetical protein L1987_41016 [Smallanthus sonchifolius]|uniref:Uncharacterized protein n=1 Tax=Smallanthus sonchifolius TaxID=185202 RepID=A0ACB9GTW3_9ASTR|nr:hypothetical protein L1987_41016 [Smallanthus sonchifolius]